MATEKTKKTRHGWHKPDDVLLGFHTSPENKAVAKITAAMLGSDVKTIMLEGMQAKARILGIIDHHGNVTPAFKDEVETAAHLIRTASKGRSKNNGNEE